MKKRISLLAEAAMWSMLPLSVGFGFGFLTYNCLIKGDLMFIPFLVVTTAFVFVAVDILRQGIRMLNK